METNLAPLVPAGAVLVTALVVLVADLFIRQENRRALVWIGLVGIGLAAGATLGFPGSGGAFENTIVFDRFAIFFSLIFLAAAALTMLSSVEYLSDAGIREGEFYALVLLSAFGMMLMAAANDLIVLFLGLETMSIGVYILTGMWRARVQAAEAAMKYFLIGAFATGFLLYGIALLYGASGSTHLERIAAVLAQPKGAWSVYLSAGIFLLLVGLAFKVAAVPFHFWAPDVYEGAPTPVTAFMAVAVKAAAFAAWARIFLYVLSPMQDEWRLPVKALAILTMTVGNVLAISQSSVKRMLAYSSIAHAGYLLIALVAGGAAGGQALLFYLLSYAAMTFGAFGVLIALKDKDQERDAYRDFAGLGFKRPFLAMAMSLCMLSLAGFPPLGGFVGKFYLFRSAVMSGHTDLAIVGALNSLLSVVYYLRVIVMMYMEEGGAEGKSFARAPYLYFVVAACMIGVIYLGIFPAPALEWSLRSFASLR